MLFDDIPMITRIEFYIVVGLLVLIAVAARQYRSSWKERKRPGRAVEMAKGIELDGLRELGKKIDSMKPGDFLAVSPGSTGPLDDGTWVKRGGKWWKVS